MASVSAENATLNRLLAALPASGFARLLPRFELVELDLRESLYERQEPIRHVWFPLRGIISMVTSMQDGVTIEVGTIGNEGMVGLPAYLGAGSAAMNCFCQVPGSALRIGVARLQEAARADAAVADVFGRYTQAFFTQLAQSVACNRLHSLQERCARWLLQTQDRALADEFPLTHEFLAQMLGVRRAGVTEAALSLQGEGVITYRQGVVTVLDRPGLEAAACECYAVIRAEYDRLIGPAPTGGG